MAHLPLSIIEQRTQLQEEILEGWQEAQGKAMYVVVCPCNLPPCPDMPEVRFPRLRVNRCFYPGELDYMMVNRPFLQDHGFEVTWLCLRSSCGYEFSCGAPSDHGGVTPPIAN